MIGKAFVHYYFFSLVFVFLSLFLYPEIVSVDETRLAAIKSPPPTSSNLLWLRRLRIFFIIILFYFSGGQSLGVGAWAQMIVFGLKTA